MSCTRSSWRASPASSSSSTPVTPPRSGPIRSARTTDVDLLEPAQPAVVRMVGWQPRRRQRDRQRQCRESGARPGRRLLPRPGASSPHLARAHADEREHDGAVLHRGRGSGAAATDVRVPRRGRDLRRRSGGGDLDQAEQRAGDLGVGRRPGAVDPQPVQRTARRRGRRARSRGRTSSSSSATTGPARPTPARRRRSRSAAARHGSSPTASS